MNQGLPRRGLQDSAQGFNPELYTQCDEVLGAEDIAWTDIAIT